MNPPTRRQLLSGTAAMLLSSAAAARVPVAWRKPFAPTAGPRSRVILINDLSGDIDGLFATVHALLSPAAQVQSIVGAPALARDQTAANSAALAREILQLMDISTRVKVFEGATAKLAAPATPVRSHGTQAIIDEAMRSDTNLPLHGAVQRVLAQAGAVLFQLQLLTARLAADGVIQVARLVADEEHGFGFFLAFGHDSPDSGKGNRPVYAGGRQFGRGRSGSIWPRLASKSACEAFLGPAGGGGNTWEPNGQSSKMIAAPRGGSGTIMQIPIVVENLGPDHYRAEASSPIGLTAEGTSSADAIQNLRTRIEEEFSNGRWIVMLDLPDENPWIQHAGQLRDESFLEDFQSALNEYRRQRDPDDA